MQSVNTEPESSSTVNKRNADSNSIYPPPLFILGSPRSFTSLVCSMIGQHPRAFGLPELNLFLSPTPEKLLQELSGYRQIQLHGLLRTVAHLCAGEQSLEAIDMARRWIAMRLTKSTSEIYRELCALIAPLRAVDKSPAYALKLETLGQLHQTFPDAHFLHLTRNPRTQGQSMMNIAQGIMAVLANSIDYTTDPPTLDPQISWLQVQKNIVIFLDAIPENRKLQLKGEDVLSEPERHLRSICRWAGLSCEDRAIDAMLHPEDSPFACLGPFGAHLGNDLNFLQSPNYRPGKVASPPLDGPLPWRSDGQGFTDQVMSMANAMGYDT